MRIQTEQEIRAHAEREYPRECCGFIVVVKGKDRYLPCDNAAATPNEHFRLRAEAYADASEVGAIVGVVHSHPNTPNKPSPADRVMCEESQLPWHIVHVSLQDGRPVATDIHSFEPCGFVMPLVGRPFSHGVLDCYSLVRDYYRQEMSIVLPDFHRDDFWWANGQNLYLDNFEAAGFSPVQGPLKVGDGILMQMRAPVPNHAAVYIGNGLILQHILGRMSSRDVYNGYFQEITRMVLRHKDAGK